MFQQRIDRRVCNELSAEVDAHGLPPRLDVKTLSGLGYLPFLRLTDLAKRDARDSVLFSSVLPTTGTRSRFADYTVRVDASNVSAGGFSRDTELAHFRN